MPMLLAGVLLLSVTANVALLFRFVYTTDSIRRDRLMSLCLAGFATTYVLFALEVTFRSVVVSDGFLITLAGQKWMGKYFHPINSLGYRDIDHEETTRSGRKFLLVTGDSFVAGHGVRDYRDRFSNVLGDLLGTGWEVGIAAKGGYGTGDAYRALTSYPVRPDLVILAYHTNDIDNAADSLGRRPNV